MEQLLDRVFVEEQINNLTNKIKEDEIALKKAKEVNEVNTIFNEIQMLKATREIYLELL